MKRVIINAITRPNNNRHVYRCYVSSPGSVAAKLSPSFMGSHMNTTDEYRDIPWLSKHSDIVNAVLATGVDLRVKENVHQLVYQYVNEYCSEYDDGYKRDIERIVNKTLESITDTDLTFKRTDSVG
jgi:hypothetical protein